MAFLQKIQVVPVAVGDGTVELLRSSTGEAITVPAITVLRDGSGSVAVTVSLWDGSSSLPIWTDVITLTDDDPHDLLAAMLPAGRTTPLLLGDGTGLDVSVDAAAVNILIEYKKYS